MSKPSSRENGPVRLFGLYSQIIRVEAISRCRNCSRSLYSSYWGRFI
ncbi:MULTISPECIES: hypothetical protein [Paenibacillus]|nr:MULTISPECIES: hypothetical protein [Paenibacillus]